MGLGMMATAKQRAWRKIFGQRYGKKKGSNTPRSRRVKTMARRRRSGRRSGGGMMRKLLMGGVAGYLANRFAPQVVPQVPKVAQNAVVGWFFGGKSIEGAVAGAAAPMLLGGVGATLGGSSSGATWE